MFLSKIFVFVFVTFHSVQALPFTDKCLHVKMMEQFDIQKFGGKWYEILRVDLFKRVTTKCHEETYAIPNDEFVVISGDFLMKNNYSSIEGVGAVIPGLPGNIMYNFPIAHIVGVMSVIDTDYDTYAALYTCNMYEFIKLEHFWIVSRKRNLSEDIIKKLLSKYEAMGGDISNVTYIDQTNCPIEGKKGFIGT